MRILTSVIAALAFAGCGGSEPSEPQAAEPSIEQRATTGAEAPPATVASSEPCPMDVDGTSVIAEHVEGGAALVFTTTGDVATLRERVRGMAATHESAAMRSESQRMGMSETMRPGSAEDPSAAAKMGEEGESGLGAAGVPEIDTRVEDVEGGARLIMVATNPTELDAVRAHAEAQAQQLITGECPMSSSKSMP